VLLDIDAAELVDGGRCALLVFKDRVKDHVKDLTRSTA
jgi:hypothetical protein